MRFQIRSISTFPFLNVLLCVVGTLVLGVLVLSLGRLSVRKEGARRHAMGAEYHQLQQQSEETAAAMARLEGLLREADATHLQLDELRKETNDLGQLRLLANRVEQELQAAQERVVALEGRVKDRRVQLEELKAIRAQRTQTKDQLPKPGSVKVLGPMRMIDREPGAKPAVASPIRPFFVECRGEQLIMHPTAIKVPVSSFEGRNAFQETVERVKREKDKGAVLILMIRPDGVKTFDRVRSFVTKQEVRYGFLPIPGFGEIDLSAFSKS